MISSFGRLSRKGLEKRDDEEDELKTTTGGSKSSMSMSMFPHHQLFDEMPATESTLYRWNYQTALGLIHARLSAFCFRSSSRQTLKKQP